MHLKNRFSEVKESTESKAFAMQIVDPGTTKGWFPKHCQEWPLSIDRAKSKSEHNQVCSKNQINKTKKGYLKPQSRFTKKLVQMHISQTSDLLKTNMHEIQGRNRSQKVAHRM